MLRLKGKGFTGKSGKRGDQLVTLMVDLPPDDAELAGLRRELERAARQPAGGRSGV